MTAVWDYGIPIQNVGVFVCCFLFLFVAFFEPHPRRCALSLFFVLSLRVVARCALLLILSSLLLARGVARIFPLTHAPK